MKENIIIQVRRRCIEIPGSENCKTLKQVYCATTHNEEKMMGIKWKISTPYHGIAAMSSPNYGEKSSFKVYNCFEKYDNISAKFMSMREIVEWMSNYKYHKVEHRLTLHALLFAT